LFHLFDVPGFRAEAPTALDLAVFELQKPSCLISSLLRARSTRARVRILNLSVSFTGFPAWHGVVSACLHHCRV
jgi:hypothetical protein